MSSRSSQPPSERTVVPRVRSKTSGEKKTRTAERSEPKVPWPKTDGEEMVKEDWRDYCDRRYQECHQHAVALEYLLNKYPEKRSWLETHGFNAQELIESLKWYPKDELEKLDTDKSKAAARAAQREQLRMRNAQNYDRMQENLLRLLPLVREVQDELESVAATQAAPALSRTKIPRPARSPRPPLSRAHSAYSTIKPIGAQWNV